jgi:hypothetical protein
MKKKSVITIASIFLNLVLFSALVYFDKINNQPITAAAPVFHLQHLSDIGYSQSDGHGMTLASTVK